MVKYIQLEKEAAAFSKANSSHPFLFEMEPRKGRTIVDSVQDSYVFKYPAKIEDKVLNLGDELGEINVRFVRPIKSNDPLPIIFYIHGAGWVFGNAHTHDKLVRELAARTNSIVIVPEYSLSPEAKISNCNLSKLCCSKMGCRKCF